MLRVNEKFLTDEEIQELLKWGESVSPSENEIENDHIKEINSYINGFSVLYDLTKTKESSYISKFQGDGTNLEGNPELLVNLRDRIAKFLGVDTTHSFVQFISMNDGGEVRPHYDAALDGFINFKANINLASDQEGDEIFVDKDSKIVMAGDLYSFEASLFRHWVGKCKSKRILLSFGFILPYADLGWKEDSPRVKMSQRIFANFQSREP